MKTKPTKIKTSDGLTPSQQAEMDGLAALPEAEIETSGHAELADWSMAKRGQFYRPVKQSLTLRVDADIVAWFKAHAGDGKGYQTNINQALRDYVKRHRD